MKTLLVRTAEKWRDWLDKHHASEAEVWLIFHKRHTGIASIAYKDALDRPPTERAPSWRSRSGLRGGMGVLEKIEELSSYRGSNPLALYAGAAAGPFKN